MIPYHTFISYPKYHDIIHKILMMVDFVTQPFFVWMLSVITHVWSQIAHYQSGRSVWKPQLSGHQLWGVCQPASWDETWDTERNEGVFQTTADHVSQTSRGTFQPHLQTLPVLLSALNIRSHSLRPQETFRSTSWLACCRGTGWTNDWREWRKRWASEALVVLQSSANRTEISWVTSWSQID